MPRLFGTDGVRGLANRELTVEIALSLGVSAAHVLTEQVDFSARRPRAVVGRDTRLSGDMLSQALCAGLASAGVDVVDVGVIPTPGVAYLAASSDVDLAAVISASHNPMPDNGIKFFARGGFKLEDGIEDQVEAKLHDTWQRPVGEQVGSIVTDPVVADRQYLDHLAACLDGYDLKGLKIVVDCANGATSNIAPIALREAGAEVVTMSASPDGRNINLGCGSTHPEQLTAMTVLHDADFGVAFDGDADRCLAVDHTGKLVDGDQIMGILAKAMKASGMLTHDTLVVTVMSNLGLLLAMKEAGIKTVQTGVGDRYVLEAMRAGGYVLGGEQSGHIISARHATTGDGTLTALLLAAEVKRSGKTLAELASTIPRLPQTLINVKNVDKNRTDDATLQAVIKEVEAHLGDTGRVLLRASGTEPLVRVMVEAATQEEADAAASQLAAVVEQQLSLG